MFNKDFFFSLGAVILLILLQVFVINNISLQQGIVPYFYILFVLIFPPSKTPYLLLFFSFLLGFGIDYFEQTGGINAFATVFVAFFRRNIISFLSRRKNDFDLEFFKLSEFNIMQWILYTINIVFIHHFILFFLDSLKISNIEQIMYKTLYTSLLTCVFIFIYLILFKKKEKT